MSKNLKKCSWLLRKHFRNNTSKTLHPQTSELPTTSCSYDWLTKVRQMYNPSCLVFHDNLNPLIFVFSYTHYMHLYLLTINLFWYVKYDFRIRWIISKYRVSSNKESFKTGWLIFGLQCAFVWPNVQTEVIYLLYFRHLTSPGWMTSSRRNSCRAVTQENSWETPSTWKH